MGIWPLPVWTSPEDREKADENLLWEKIQKKELF